MQLGRRAALVGLAALSGTRAHAGEWPQKGITWIVPYPADGPTDIFARPLARHASALLGQPIAIDYRAGAGGTRGALQVARSAADGYTMLVGNTSLTYAPMIYRHADLDLMRDFAPVSAFARTPTALVVNPDRLSVSTLAQFVAAAKRKPGSIELASSGLGSVSHLAIVMLQNRIGAALYHVPYPGNAPALQDLLKGHVVAMFSSINTVVPHIRAGRLRALGVAGHRREPVLPDVPTMEEAGFKGFYAATWFGLFAPRDTPSLALDGMRAAIQLALDSDEIKRVWVEQAAKVEPESRAAFAAFVGQEEVRWSAIARAANIQLE
jgi:tripartite-type tricarboxylate transporter receptor subunit TctC